ncbi:putative 22 kDa protein in overamplified macronuclear DNA POB4 [Bienertia sinuspersici]
MVNQAEFATLLDEFKKLNAHIDQIEERLAQWEAIIRLTRKTVCYRFQGLGHVAKHCPNRSMVTRKEYYTFLLHNMNDIWQMNSSINI